MYDGLLQRWYLLVFAAVCFGVGISHAFMLLDGNVTIAGVFEVQSEENKECGEINVASVMVMEAVRWYLATVNNAETLPFKIGLKGYKTCGNTGLAGQHAVEILSRYKQAKLTNTSEDFTVGVLGPTYSSEAQVVSSILGSQIPSDRFLLLGYSSTSTVLNDRVMYPNFYRVIPEDSVQITAMVQLMASLEWNRIGVIYENDTYGRIGAETLETASVSNKICVSKMYPITIDDSRHVDIAELRSIIDTIVVKSPSIHGVVYIGSKTVANKILQIVNSLEFTDLPIFLLSESTQLQLDVFQSTDGKILPKTKGSLVVSAPFSEVSDFKEYWNSLFKDLNTLNNAAKHNPYLHDVFRDYTGCDVTRSTCTPMTDAQINEKASPQSVYVMYAVFATHTLVEAVKKVIESLCNGKCSSFYHFKDNFEPSKVLEAMDNLVASYNNLTMSFTKDSANAQLGQNFKAYEAYNFRKITPGDKFGLVNVGYLLNGNFFIDRDKIKDYAVDGSERSYPNVRKGQCPVRQTCDECIYSEMTEVDFHIPGDFYVVGKKKFILDCKIKEIQEIKYNIKFALEEFKTRGWYADHVEKFSEHSIGLIVINSCNNALEVVRKILSLHSNGLKLPNGEYLDVTNRILGYVGDQSTDVSEPAAVQLTKLGFIQISYSATNPVLSDKQKYPYFLRIITPDDVQAKAMIDIIKELKGEYIQIVYSEGAYGEGGKDAVKKAAAIAGICIAQEILVLEQETYYEHYETLRKKPHAKLVIIFLRSHVVGPLMRDLNVNMKRGEFQFIGSEAWGKNGEVLDYDINKGSITVAVEMDKNSYLEEYLESRTPTFNDTNPWLEEYIQNRQNCFFDWSYDKSFSRKCTKDILPQNEENFESDPWCIFVFNTMISFLKGASNFYSSKCGKAKNSEICEDFVNGQKEFVEVLKKVKMNIFGTGDILVYDSRGDGLMGYIIYNIKDNVDRSQREYTPVGSYSLGSGLQFQTRAVGYPTGEVIQSVCPSEQACQACQPEEKSTTSKSSSDPTVPALGAVVGILIVIIIILIIVLILRLRSRPPQEHTYITPSNLSSGMTYPTGEREIGEGKHHSDDSNQSEEQDEKF